MKLSFNYQKPFNGELFLNKYVNFTKGEAEMNLKENIARVINNEIENHTHNLKIANEINLAEPILKSIVDVGNTSVVNEPDALFYKGSRVLTIKLENLQNTLEEIQSFQLEYNPIVDKASSSVIISKNISYFLITSLAIGLMITIFTFIFVKIIFFEQN